MKLFIPPRRGDPVMCPLLCPECRSPIQLPDRCSHATCRACGLILEELPAIDGDEAFIDRSNNSSNFRTRVPSSTLGRWQRLRFLQWTIDWEVARHGKVQEYLRRLKAALAIQIPEETILSLFARIKLIVHANRLHISPEALVSALCYAQAKDYGLPVDFDAFIAHAGLTKHRFFRMIGRLSKAGLRLPQSRSIADLHRQVARGILEKVMAAVLAAFRRSKAAGLVSKRDLRLLPIFKALHVAPSTAYKIGHDHKLFTPPSPLFRTPKGSHITAKGVS